MSEALKLDKLLKKPAFQALFHFDPVNKNKNSPGEKTRNTKKDKPSCCFISQNRNSPVPKSLTPSYSRIKCYDKLLNEDKERLIQVDREMKEIRRKSEVEWGRMDENLPARRRKSAFDKVKNLQGLYKEKKQKRLSSIKRQRILKNAYPEGLESKIYNWNDGFLVNDQRKQSNS